MATTNFVDGSTLTAAAWFNDADALIYQGNLDTALNITAGDTSAGDIASIGYTSTEGIIITGQGSSEDVTVKNDADAVIWSVATGTIVTDFAGDVTIADGKGLVIGGESQQTVDGITSECQVLGTGGEDSNILIGRWAADANAGKLEFYKSRNGTIGSNTAVTTGDQLGEIRALGDDGTDDDTNSSAIIFDTEGTILAGQVPGVIKFQTAAAGSVTDRMIINSSGIVSIGTDTSGNANMTTGLTINQAAADNEILALKSSDVTHGITDKAETDTYGTIGKSSFPGGGIQITGFSDTSSTTGNNTVHLRAYTQDTAYNTTKSTAAKGAITMDVAITDGGTSIAIPGADENLVVIRALTTARFIFDQEGTFHADVASTTFDEHDDVELLNAMDMESRRRKGDPIKEEYQDWLIKNKEILQREKVVNYYDDDGPRAMVNQTKLAMLHTGAIRQLGNQVKQLQSKLNLLENNSG